MIHRDSGSSDTFAPFVGRAGELAQLGACRERALGGELSVMMLAGEAGAGKTRLGEEFGQLAMREGDLFLKGGAVELQG